MSPSEQPARQLERHTDRAEFALRLVRAHRGLDGFNERDGIGQSREWIAAFAASSLDRVLLVP